jgi:hypothetical protein
MLTSSEIAAPGVPLALPRSEALIAVSRDGLPCGAYDGGLAGSAKARRRIGRIGPLTIYGAKK